MANPSHCPIAITGIAALFPGSVERIGFWRDILAGADLLSDVPSTHWRIEDYFDPDPAAPDKTYAKRGAFLPKVEFNSLEFGIPPSNLSATDTAQLLALIVARQTLEDASRGQFQKLDRDRISVILGVASGTELLTDMASRLQHPVWRRALRDSGVPEALAEEVCQRISASYAPWQESTFPGLLGNVVAGRIANRLDLHGANCVVDAACASSLAAIAMGLDELYLGNSDLVLVGGVDALNNIFMYHCFSKTPAMSPSGDCRPFSDQADGTMLGEGIGMFALRRLADAERDGDPVYAVLSGLGSSSDGSARSVYAPEAKGQAMALKRAYAAAGFGPETIELVEAHGTGTKAGDAAEFAGLRMVYDNCGRTVRQWCALGSVKSQIGHTKAAAGAAGLFKAVMALHHKVLPPTIKVARPNPAMAFEQSAFYLNTCARPWIRDSRHPRRAAVSSFGFGGSNFHLVLEEYTGHHKAAKLRTFTHELVVLAEDSVHTLQQRCQVMLERCGTTGSLAHYAADTQNGFDASKPHRLSFVAVSEQDLRKKIARALVLLQRDGDQPFADPRGIYRASGAQAGAVAFLFPGQGSQYVNMGAPLAMAFEPACAAWDLAADLVPGLDRVVFPTPVFDDEARTRQQNVLTDTYWAQVAIGAASLAYLNVLQEIGVTATCVAGHSFGEVTALHAAGVLDRKDFLRAAKQRGELMAAAAAAAPEGAMTAAALSPELIDSIAQWGAGVSVANINSPQQVVLTGAYEAIERAETMLAQYNVSYWRLPVATAFHSPLVAAACVPFESFLHDVALHAPCLPVLANTTAQRYPSDVEAIRALLAQQIARPVLFSSDIEAMYAGGVRIFIEVGPGHVLTRRVSECLAGRPHVAIAMDRRGATDLCSFWHALAQLAVAGVPMRLQALSAAYAAPPDPWPVRQKAGNSIAINGANYGKPVPKNMNPPPPQHDKPAEVTMNHHHPESTIPDPYAVDASTTLPAAEPPARSAYEGDASGWLTTLGQIQNTHAAFQKAMTDGHLAYLKVMETFALHFPADAAVSTPVQTNMPAQRLAVEPAFVAQADAPVMKYAKEPAKQETPTAPTVTVAGITRGADIPAHQPAAPAFVMPPAPSLPDLRTVPPAPQTIETTKLAAPVQAPVDASELTGFKTLLLDVVAEKTGYPTDVLELTMDLESDLGIDSIKRIEILSAIEERMPALPKFQASQMAELRTLGAIIEYMEVKFSEKKNERALPMMA